MSYSRLQPRFMRGVAGAAVVVLATMPMARSAGGCQVAAPIDAEYMVREADLIVLAIAREYARPPASKIVPEWIGMRLATTVRFEIVETIAGEVSGESIEIEGVLTDRDDFNDHQPPYEFVRPAGRRGNCWAYDYKQGAMFLLLLRGDGDRFRTNWYGLAPVSEQVTGADDPWVAWVKEYRKYRE